MENYEILWKNVLVALEKSVSTISFDTYITKLKPVDIDGTKIILCTETELFASQIAHRLLDKIRDALTAANTGLTDVEICIGSSREDYLKTIGYAKKELPIETMPIDPKYTFESFVVGGSNKMLYAAARAVAEAPGNSYNPLFIYGGTGLGKTHIMHAIANYIKLNTPKTNVLYATCEKFTNDLIDSIRDRSTSRSKDAEFRTKYRNVDVLIIDDVQFLAKKKTTQEEFFNTFNELFAQNKQIILSSDCPPKEIETLEERLRTRFEGGLMAQVLPPDIETKIAIIQRKATEKKYILPIDVASYLSENSESNVRTLEGLLNKVIFASILHESPITLELAIEALKETASETTEVVTATNIINSVCSFYSIAKPDLLGKKRNKELVVPRQICAYLITELVSLPLISVGQAIGGRDYTTVIHSRDKIANLIQVDSQLATEVRDLKNLILKK